MNNLFLVQLSLLVLFTLTGCTANTQHNMADDDEIYNNHVISAEERSDAIHADDQVAPETVIETVEETPPEEKSELTLIKEIFLNSFGLFDLLPDDFDVNELYLEHRAMYENAVTLAERYIVLQNFVWHFGDGHSGVRFPQSLTRYYSPIQARYIDGMIVVIGSDSGSTKLLPGDVIVSINDMEALDYLQTYHYQLSHPQPYLAGTYRLVGRFFLSDVTSREVRVVARTPGGEFVSDTLIYVSTQPYFDRVLPNRNYRNLNDYPEFQFSTFYAQKHENNILRIRVDSFSNENFPSELRGFLTSEDFSGDSVVIDARGHSGGNDLNGLALLSHFIDLNLLNHNTNIARSGGHYSMGTNVWGQFWMQTTNNGSAGLFHVPVVILTDHRSGSAGENFVSAAKGIDRFTIIGTTTAGVTGQLAFHDLPSGGLLFLTTLRAITSEGYDISRRGITPDIWVEQSFTDLLAGIDTQLKAAIIYLMN